MLLQKYFHRRRSGGRGRINRWSPVGARIASCVHESPARGREVEESGVKPLVIGLAELNVLCVMDDFNEFAGIDRPYTHGI